MAPCELLAWDTEFWGTGIARVARERLDDAIAAEVDAWAKANDVACVYYLAPGDDASSAHAAERAGFGLMDVRVELARQAERAPLRPAIREARDDDRAKLRRIASSSHGVTRFYADPRFPNDRCDALYDTWIRRSLEGWADGVLVAEVDGTAAGYVSCHLDDATGSIGLIAVDGAARGAGLGVDLARGAVAWCAERGARTMTVVTQGRNVPALRTFVRAGFAPSSVDLWFHKWYS